LNEPKSLPHQFTAHRSRAETENRTARTAKARKAFEDTFSADSGGDPKRAESARKAYFLELALKSAQARRKRGGTP
jgi:hypothetical protein